MKDFYPMTFEPVLKDYIWGGRNLEKLGRALPPEGVIAESWEIAAHEDGTTRVNNGRWAGQLLTEVQAKLGLDLIGRRCAWAQERGKFPLLIKLLDAERRLSVQVHPRDDYALAHEGNELGKNEMWVVLQARAGAEIVLGVKEGTNRHAFRQAIEEGHLDDHLHHLAVEKGDHVCVPAGTLHTILGGMVVAEIQQNSNTTYRVYDWNRVGQDGEPRALHVDKALDVIDFDRVEPALPRPMPITESGPVRRWQLCRNEYFSTERVEMDAGARFTGNCDGQTLEIWGVVQGEAEANDVHLAAVRFVLLPAALGAFAIEARTKATLLRTYVAAETG